MFPNIYIEEELIDESMVSEICQRFPSSDKVICRRYTEVFNKKSQNFRLQKQNPSLILAKKKKGWVLPTPEGYGIGGTKNYYFSHMLNCLYDCRYCFLQGLYSSANYVVFINYEDFKKEIDLKLNSHPDEDVYFFSGYDCDSLAMEPITAFFNSFYPFFKERPRAYLELRTKSYLIKSLLDKPPIPNCIVAFTLSPDAIANEFEFKAPPVRKRIQAMKRLQEAGWKVAIRLDPILYTENSQQGYRELLQMLSQEISFSDLHSVTIGTFRMPKAIFKNMLSLYPEEPLFHCSLQENQGQICYPRGIEAELLSGVYQNLLEFISPSKIFRMGDQETL